MNKYSDIDASSSPKTSATEEINALDEMFTASRHYRKSSEYIDMLRFIGKFTKYSPFNCLLLYTQNKTASYVATANQWRKKFKRFPKRDAMPMLILAPMSPVVFVYDLKDTEGKPVPDSLLRPFYTDGVLKKGIIDSLKHNCTLHEIEVREITLRHWHGGSALRLNDKYKQFFRDLNISDSAKYLILLDRDATNEDKYSLILSS